MDFFPGWDGGDGYGGIMGGGADASLRAGMGDAFLGGGRTVGGGLCPALGQGVCAGRVSVRALRCARGMEWESHQPTFRNLLYPLLLFPRHSASLALAGWMRGMAF